MTRQWALNFKSYKVNFIIPPQVDKPFVWYEIECSSQCIKAIIKLAGLCVLVMACLMTAVSSTEDRGFFHCIYDCRHLSDFLHLLIYDFLGFCCSRSELQPVPHKLHPNKEATAPAGCDSIWFSHIWHTKNPVHICLLLTNVGSRPFLRYSCTESQKTCSGSWEYTQN